MRVPFLVVLTLLIILLASTVRAQIPRTILYQGLLTDTSGAPRPNGAYSFFFRLYDTSVGGHEIWRELKQLEVKRGLFSTSLGDQQPFEGLADFSKPYWLGIQVGAEPELSPRILLGAVAYSFRTINADSSTRARYADSSTFAQSAGIPGGVVVRSLNGLHDNIILSGSGGATVISSGDSIFIAASGGGGGTGIQGVQNTNNTLDIANPNGPTATINLKLPFSASTSTEATTFGVMNLSSGVALFGSSQSNDGVYGISANPAKSGMWGDNPGGGYGVSGSTGGASTAGVWGSNSSSGFGVKGTSSTGSGVYGQAAGTLVSYGVAGENIATSGLGAGVYGRSASPTGKGVFGWTNNATGVNYAIYGETGSPTGFAGYFVGRGYFSANVGIGTESPEAPLHVANQIRVGKDLTYPNVYGEIKHDGGSSGFIINAHALGGWADLLFQTDGVTRMFIESQGNVGIGTATPAAKLDVNGTAAVNVLQINGGSDVAEPFEADDAASIEPGTLMVLDAVTPGKVSISTVPYDKKVAGIVSGAGGIKAGLTLRQEHKSGESILVAIAGRVYCKAVGPIETGDLLTTSGIPGHAMRAVDRDRSHGAIIGKAMSRLEEGTGLVLVLVNLQ